MNPSILITQCLLLGLIFVCHGATTNRMQPETITGPSKRSLIEFGAAWPNEWNTGQQWFPNHRPVPTQMEVSSAIAAARQASENVQIAQQQMIAAKENVLQQQKLASDREANAAIARQKLEASAAIQRSEAAAAAQSVIQAQQRFAATKATLAHHQKIASIKEAHAASYLQSSAQAAATEIQRTENEIAKLSTLQRNDAAAALHHVAATKDASLAPITLGINRIPGQGSYPFGPWSTGPGMTGAFFNPPPTSPAFLNPHAKPSPILWG